MFSQVTKTFVQSLGLQDDPAGLELVISQFIKGAKDSKSGSGLSSSEAEIVSKVERILFDPNGTSTPFLFAASQNCSEMIVYGSEYSLKFNFTKSFGSEYSLSFVEMITCVRMWSLNFTKTLSFTVGTGKWTTVRLFNCLSVRIWPVGNLNLMTRLPLLLVYRYLVHSD